MCKQSTCGTCNKATWWGCGQHVPSVMDSIADTDRCTCEPKVEKEGKQYPPQGPALGMIKAMFGFGGSSSSESSRASSQEKAGSGDEL